MCGADTPVRGPEVGPAWYAQRNRRFHSSANMRTAMPTTIPINRARLFFPVIVST